MQSKKQASFMEATGTIAYNMTNNYMFRFILQKNKKVLKGLICALLHLKPEQIKSIEITNPINLSGDVSGKEFIENYHLYSDKFTLSVLNLSKIYLATEEDKRYEIDYWARLFKAKTWEELKELVKDKEYLQEAADSIYKANADEIVRQRCRAREEAERRERTLERDIKKLKDYSTELEGNIVYLKENVSDLEEKNLQQELLIKELQEKIASLENIE